MNNLNVFQQNKIISFIEADLIFKYFTCIFKKLQKKRL